MDVFQNQRRVSVDAFDNPSDDTVSHTSRRKFDVPVKRVRKTDTADYHLGQFKKHYSHRLTSLRTTAAPQTITPVSWLPEDRMKPCDPGLHRCANFVPIHTRVLQSFCEGQQDCKNKSRMSSERIEVDGYECPWNRDPEPDKGSDVLKGIDLDESMAEMPIKSQLYHQGVDSWPRSQVCEVSVPQIRPERALKKPEWSTSKLKGSHKRRYNSLGLLCENFIKLYGNHSNEEFFIDEISEKLGVERRRIYDIVNILESLGIVVKKKRNHYKWHGVDRIPFTLIALKVSCDSEGDARVESSIDDDGQDFISSSESSSVASTQHDDEVADETEREVWKEVGAHHRYDQNDKCIGVLTQRFIRLFLHSKAAVIGFQEISRMLLGQGENVQQTKTGIRRLYDIVNVLSALQLIQKTQKRNGEIACRWLASEISYLCYFTSKYSRSHFGNGNTLEYQQPVTCTEKARVTGDMTGNSEEKVIKLNEHLEPIPSVSKDEQTQKDSRDVKSELFEDDGIYDESKTVEHKTFEEQVSSIDCAAQVDYKASEVVSSALMCPSPVNNTGIYPIGVQSSTDNSELMRGDSTGHFTQRQLSYLELYRTAMQQWQQWIEQTPPEGSLASLRGSGMRYPYFAGMDLAIASSPNMFPPFFFPISPFPLIYPQNFFPPFTEQVNTTYETAPESGHINDFRIGSNLEETERDKL